MKILKQKLVNLSIAGAVLTVGGLFLASQIQNTSAQASEPTKLVAFDKQASALGQTIDNISGSETVKATLDKAQTESKKKSQTEQSQEATKTLESNATQQVDNTNISTTEVSATTQSESSNVAQNNTPNTNQSSITQQSSPTPAPKPQVDTSGFNFNGHHYPIAWFSGTGYVPADGNIYRWSEMPNHYLIERAGMADGTIRELGVGSQVTIDGRTYTIFKMLSGVANDENAYDLLISQGAAITFQSCDATYGANGLANLTIWFAA